MAGKRKVYAAEFKLSAVKMITDQKLSVAEVARRLGIVDPENWTTSRNPLAGCLIVVDQGERE